MQRIASKWSAGVDRLRGGAHMTHIQIGIAFKRYHSRAATMINSRDERASAEHTFTAAKRKLSAPRHDIGRSQFEMTFCDSAAHWRR